MEENSRTFIAIELGLEIRQTIKAYISNFLKHYSSGFRWVKPESIHVTLKFIGDTPVNKIQTISKILGEICTVYESFPLQIDSPGAFPSWRQPRTIWIGLKTSTQLIGLFKRMDSALAAAGIPSEGRNFSPHLTLCRVSDHADQNTIQQASKEFLATPLKGEKEWLVNRVVFFKSRLQPGGPIYSHLSEHCLKNPSKV